MTQLTTNFFSRSIVAMCAVVLLTMGVFGVVGVERAYAITNTELVNLFIALEIIPEENAEHARVVVAGQDGELPSSDLTELFIALEIIPEEKVEQARAVVAGAGTTGPELYTPPGGLYIEPIRTDAVLLQHRFVERGKYRVMFDLTAAEDTFYMRVDPDKSLRFFIEGGIYGALGPSSDQQHVTLTSTAPQEGAWYVIEEGNTETFTLENIFTPTADGAYTFELGYVDYTDTPEGANRYYVEAAPRTDYRTNPLELSVSSFRYPSRQDVYNDIKNRHTEVQRRVQERHEMLRNRIQEQYATIHTRHGTLYRSSIFVRSER